MRALHLLAATVALLMTGSPSPGDTVCRPTQLGTQRCTGPAVRPEPRPVLRSDRRSLERVQRAGDAARPHERFVPARETERLGGSTITDRPVGGPCRPDRLGNLYCR